MTIFDKVDYSPLRKVSRRKPRSLNSAQKRLPKILGGTPSPKSH